MLVVYWGVGGKRYKATVLANLSIRKKTNKASQCFCFFALFISYLFILIAKKQSAKWSVSLIHSFYIDCKSSSRVKGQQYFPGYRQKIAIPQEWKSKVLYEFSINKSTLWSDLTSSRLHFLNRIFCWGSKESDLLLWYTPQQLTWKLKTDPWRIISFVCACFWGEPSNESEAA